MIRQMLKNGVARMFIESIEPNAGIKGWVTRRASFQMRSWVYASLTFDTFLHMWVKGMFRTRVRVL